jgi:hypothetical protein
MNHIQQVRDPRIQAFVRFYEKYLGYHFIGGRGTWKKIKAKQKIK